MTTVVQTDSGSFIPASQRPDGTWRKARRVKDGYVPQEEVPLYESKGKQWANKQPMYPVGLDPELIKRTENLKVNEEVVKSKKKKKKKEKVEAPPEPIFVIQEPAGVPKHVKQKSVKPETSDVKNKIELKKEEPMRPDVDPAKKLKNLKKKLREIEVLETKLKSKELKNPEKDQLDKVSRKADVISDIAALEELVKQSL